MRSLKIKEVLQLKSIVVVFDQVLYVKATEIVWKQKDKFNDIVLRMGAFLTICTLLSIMFLMGGDTTVTSRNFLGFPNMDREIHSEEDIRPRFLPQSNISEQ